MAEYIDIDAPIDFRVYQGRSAARATSSLRELFEKNDARWTAADVREVVRCKDCLHFSYDDVEGGWCDEWGKEVGSPNFYCADADMREEQT